jgi:hypothetical protein
MFYEIDLRMFKNVDWAHFTLAIYLRKKIKIIKLLRNYYKNDL